MFVETTYLVLELDLSLDPLSESVSLLAINATAPSSSASDPSSSSVESPQVASMALVNLFPELFPELLLG